MGPSDGGAGGLTWRGWGEGVGSGALSLFCATTDGDSCGHALASPVTTVVSNLADLRISGASVAALRGRFRSPEGEKALLKLVDLLVEAVVDEVASEVQEPAQPLKKPKEDRGPARS